MKNKGYWIRTEVVDGRKIKKVYAYAKYKSHTLRQYVGPDTPTNRAIAKEQAMKWLAERIEQVHVPDKAKREITVPKFCEYFFDNHSLRKASSINDRIYLDRFSEFSGNMLLRAVNQDHIMKFLKWLESLKGRGGKLFKRNYINRHLQTLRTFFNRAKDWGYYNESNPVVGKMIANEELFQRTRYLTQEEFSVLLELCDEVQKRQDFDDGKRRDVPCSILKPIIVVAAHSGLRKKELMNVRKRDVDLTSGCISIPHPKSQRPEWVAMSDTVAEIVRESVGRLKSPDEKVIDCTGFDRQWKKLMKAWVGKGYEAFRFHDLRHTFASHVAPHAKDLMTLRGLMRHRDIKMTLKYAHLFPGSLSSAVKGLDNALVATTSLQSF